jgi:predicted 3-demethylubiquinone-9 3-methyltransferase (glyoxalase superfamily)
MASVQNISVNLWFDKQAEEAVNYYVTIFSDSRIIRTSHYGSEGHDIHKMPEGLVMAIEFELNGSRFIALNGGPVFKFNEAVSLVITCNDQEEVDYYWNKLTAGGDESAQQCGWLKDKFGLSWQVVPAVLHEMMADTDRQKTEQVMKVMMQMTKLNIEALELAYRTEV